MYADSICSIVFIREHLIALLYKENVVGLQRYSSDGGAQAGGTLELQGGGTFRTYPYVALCSSSGGGTRRISARYVTVSARRTASQCRNPHPCFLPGCFYFHIIYMIYLVGYSYK